MNPAPQLARLVAAVLLVAAGLAAFVVDSAGPGEDVTGMVVACIAFAAAALVSLGEDTPRRPGASKGP